MESTPDLLESISIKPVMGNEPKTLNRCKDPKEFFSVLDRNKIIYPEICFTRELDNADRWLCKSSASTGGLGISPHSFGLKYDKYEYYQRRLEGVNFSLTFLANGKEIKCLGFNSLWRESLGEKFPYAYSGAINTVELTDDQKLIATGYANILAREFDLIGLNGIDYILYDDSVYVLEINPRIPATFELYETRQGDLIKQHIDACTTKKIDSNKWHHLLRAHAIVYAPELIQIPESFSWPLWTADRPHPQEQINKHEPVCSVFSGGKNVAQVRNIIHTRKQTILNKLKVSLN